MLKKVLIYLFAIGVPLMGTIGCSTKDFSFESNGKEKKSFVNLKISTPSSDGVIYTKALHEQAEWEIKSLNLYLFESSAGSADSDCLLMKIIESPELISKENGEYILSIPIDHELMNKSVKILAVANDKPAPAVLQVTSLSQIKQSLASAVVEDGSNADMLVGNRTLGFPMSAMATVEGNEILTLDPKGVNCTVSIVRTVARLDIENKTPNLTLKDVILKNAVNKSWLYPQDAWSLPNDSRRITLKATVEWENKLQNGVKYNTSSPDLNLLKHVLYMYEDDQSSFVEITFSLDIDGVEKEGKVSVALKGDLVKQAFPVRNTLYKIQLGDGKPVGNDLKVSQKLIVKDWQTGEVINGALSPDKDKQ